MKVEVTVDGETRAVEVDLDRGVVRWGGKERPGKVLGDDPYRVEVEVAGERFVVEGWAKGVADPPSPLPVAGENYAVKVARKEGGAARAPKPVAGGSASPVVPPAPAPGGGTAIVPPMPGKVVELRVKAGERVTKGQVLLVLEAMKMRNEVASPVAGVVGDLKVETGANVRAREIMLTVVPDPPAV